MVEVGPGGGKPTVAGAVSVAQDRAKEVKRPRINQGHGTLSRPVFCHVRPGLNPDRERRSWSGSETPPMTRDGKGCPLLWQAKGIQQT